MNKLPPITDMSQVVLYYEYDPVTGQPIKVEELDLTNKAITPLFESPGDPKFEIMKVAPAGKDPWLIWVDRSKMAAQPIPLARAASFAQGWGILVPAISMMLDLHPVYLPAFKLDN